MQNVYYYYTVIGKIGICEKDGLISEILFLDDSSPDKDNLDGLNIMETKTIIKASKQLDEYFALKRKTFDLPLLINGTVFQTKVWEALVSIPYGEVRSYKDIAVQIGRHKASRAVGMANNRNRLPIIIPCHRVIGLKGQLVGYGGGLTIKEKLLEVEGNTIVNSKIKL